MNIISRGNHGKRGGGGEDMRSAEEPRRGLKGNILGRVYIAGHSLNLV